MPSLPALAALVAAVALALPAQTLPPAQAAPTPAVALPSYEGQPVASLELAGRPGLDPAPILPTLAQQPGQPFSRAAIDRSIATLVATRQYASVQLDIRPETDGLRVLLVLQPALYFGVFRFPGAAQFSYPQLLQVADYPTQEPYTPADVTRAAAALQIFFQRQGYFQAQVHAQVQADPRHGLANVAFQTTLGRRAKVGQVLLDGAPPAQAAALQGSLRSWLARFKGAALLPGKSYSYRNLQNATAGLQSALAKKGYLAAEVHLAGARFDPATGRAAITFTIVPGPLIHVQVRGAHLWPWTRHSLLPLYQQAGVDPEIVQEGQQNLLDYFASKGYFAAQVTSTVVPPFAAPGPAAAPAAPATPADRTIAYTIAKGPRRSVAAVSLATSNGAPLLHDARSQLTIQTRHFLSHGDYSPQRVAASAANLKNLYRAAGYNSVQVTTQVTHPGGNLAVAFAVHPGPRDIVARLVITGNATLSPQQFAPGGLRIAAGAPYSQSRIAADRNQILERYLDLGFLNASFRATAQALPNQPHQLLVTYAIAEGPQVRIAAIVTDGRQVTQQRLIDDDTAALQSQRYLTEKDLLTAESQLYSSGIFDWTEVAPHRPITTQTAEDVVVKLHEAKRNSLTYGFGFDITNRGGSIPSGTVAVPGLPPIGLPSSFATSEATFYGPDANVEYTRINISGKAASFNAGGYAGRLDQRVNTSFLEPHLGWSIWGGSLLASAEHNSENPIFTSRQGQVGVQLQRPLSRDKKSNLFLRYSFSQTDLTRLLIPALVPPQDLSVRLSTFSASFIRDTRDNPLDAHKGIYESYELDYNPIVFGSSANFAKLATQTSYYHRVFGKTIWANSLRLGFEQALDGSFVPLSEAFFSGGGSTLRGFPLDGAGPQRTIPACGNPAVASTCTLINVPVGGNQLLILNSELRIPTPIEPGLGVAAFYDGGNVFSRIGFSNLGASYTNTVGLGLRYQTPVGPLRLDFGHLLSAPPGIKSTQIFFTLGQAF